MSGPSRAERSRGGRRAQARAALGLRTWALKLLAGDPEACRGDALARVAAVAPGAWTLFLRAERCAVPVSARLGKAAEALPAPIRATLAERALVESQRILSARAQLRTLSRIAREQGWPMLVLKGGTAAAGSDPVDLQDVDVLTRSGDAAALAACLEEAEGYGRHGRDVAVGAAGAHQLAIRRVPGGVPVEVHFTLPFHFDLSRFWGRARPLADQAPLLRPGPEDHLWHLLVHTVAQHPEFRGSVRDLVLLSAAVREADAEGSTDAAVRAAADAAPAGGVHDAVRMARAMAAGVGWHEPDPFRLHAAVRVLLVQRFAGDGAFTVAHARAAHALAVGWGEFRAMARARLQTPLRSSRTAVLPRPMVVAARALLIGGAAAAALPLARTARALAAVTEPP